MTDAAGALVWDRVARPFGAAYSVGGSKALALRFPGQVEDAATALHYNYFRDYDPSLGRYNQSDPIGLRGGVNTYAYVGGNPLAYIDPLGLVILPDSPSGLPSEWTLDPNHRNPNGSKWDHPSGDSLEFHQGQEGRPGWGGRDHWHYNGGHDHLPPGSEIPDPPAEETPQDPPGYWIPRPPFYPWLLPPICLVDPSQCNSLGDGTITAGLPSQPAPSAECEPGFGGGDPTEPSGSPLWPAPI